MYCFPSLFMITGLVRVKLETEDNCLCRVVDGHSPVSTGKPE